MANGVITEGSLSLLGSSAVEHQMKGFSLHLATDFNTLKCHPARMKAFVSDVRSKLATLHDVDPNDIVIMSMRDGSTMIDVSINSAKFGRRPLPEQYRRIFGNNFLGCSVHPSFRQMQIKPSTWHPRWNRDYRVPGKCPVGEKRGGYPYAPPAGWQRFGMMVKGKYADGDDWINTRDGSGHWAVVYHGTKPDKVKPITESPLKPGPRAGYGPGIYCSPNPKKAEEFTTQPPSVATRNGPQKFKYMIMCRVDMSSPCHCKENPCKRLDDATFTVHITQGRDAWLVTGKNARCIRPYGVLFKEC
jgi:hypothetical protein